MNIYSEAARWLALLPLGSRDEVAKFTGVTAGEAKHAIEMLAAAGWLYTHEIAEHDDAPLFALSPAAMEQLTRAPAAGGLDLGRVPPGQLRRRAVASAIVAEPVTVIINAAMAAIAVALRRDGGGVLADAVYRPASPKARSMSRDSRPVLRWGHIEGRARAQAAGGPVHSVRRPIRVAHIAEGSAPATLARTVDSGRRCRTSYAAARTLSR